MPRQLLRDGRIVTDDWRYLTEVETASATPPAAITAGAGADGLIIPLARWQAQREHWSAHPGRLGVALLPADKVELLVPDLARFTLVAAEFPGPSDGRGYTQGRLLRERHHFTGELRAAGYVRRDQLFFLARCGFNSFQLAQNELAAAATALTTFSAEYQPSNDAGLSRALPHRNWGRPSP
jgi:uncharacterized protein (DUF934 family)